MRQAIPIPTRPLASIERGRSIRRPAPTALIVPVAAGIAGGLMLVALYVGLVTWAQGLTHARELLWSDRYFVGAIAAGFGTQLGLYAHIRRTARARLMASAGGLTAAGTGTSTVAMVACCAHHAADALPLLGLSAAAVFLNDYRLPVMAAGLATNALGIGVLARVAISQRGRADRYGAAS